MGGRDYRSGAPGRRGERMTQNIDMELLRRIVNESGVQGSTEDITQLIHDLLSEEFDVQHMIRPHKILTKLTAHIDAHNGE